MLHLKRLSPYVALLFISLLQTARLYSQVIGCKDPAANNYNPAATVGDSSCTYNTTFYTPPVKVDPLSSTLVETSGLQMAGNFLWSFNDGGNAAAIYRIDTITNAVLQTVNLGGAANTDWEDIAFDGTDFYIGDFGNNATGGRTDLKIYKFPISAINTDYTTNPIVTIPSAQIEVINFSYSDQGTPIDTTANSTKWDCEAMFVDAGKIHLFSKNWIDVNTTHYVINGVAAGTYVATPLETLNTGYLVTAADKVPGANVVALLGYRATGFADHFLHLLSDFSGGRYFNGNRRRIDLPNVANMGQAEGICFRNATYGYISSERFSNVITVEPKLRSFNTESFIPAYVLPLSLTTFTVKNRSGRHQVDWAFAQPVKDLQLLHSDNQINFVSIKNMGLSTAGSFMYAASGGISCYKLAWQQADGNRKYSSIICVDDNVKAGLTNVVLRRSGALSFVVTGGEAGDYLFRLITTDGKTITEKTQHLSAAGFFTIQLPHQVAGNTLILVQAIGSRVQHTSLVKVEE